LHTFQTLLEQLSHADEAAVLALLDAHTEPDSPFWLELREARQAVMMTTITPWMWIRWTGRRGDCS
jgi:hypothetical protein